MDPSKMGQGFLPNSIGGLRLRDPNISNKILSAKIWWNQFSYNSKSWAQLLNLKYVEGWDTQDIIRYSLNYKGSLTWKFANQQKNIIQKHSLQWLRDGSTTHIQTDTSQKLPIISIIFQNEEMQLAFQNNNNVFVSEFQFSNISSRLYTYKYLHRWMMQFVWKLRLSLDQLNSQNCL